LNNKENIPIWLEKARRYCSQQDRCVFEVQKKLRDWGCEADKMATIINQLEKENYIDEQRFADSFARGKFRMKAWGKLKIMAALIQFRIPQGIIIKALNTIDDKEYQDTLKDILEKKWRFTTGEPGSRINKTATYAIGKGYESSLVFEIINSLNKT